MPQLCCWCSPLICGIGCDLSSNVRCRVARYTASIALTSHARNVGSNHRQLPWFRNSLYREDNSKQNIKALHNWPTVHDLCSHTLNYNGVFEEGHRYSMMLTNLICVFLGIVLNYTICGLILYVYDKYTFVHLLVTLLITNVCVSQRS